MRVLIVYAHPGPLSFTGSMRDVAVQALHETGHEVEVSDLYAEEFNPRAGRHASARWSTWSVSITSPSRPMRPCIRPPSRPTSPGSRRG